MPTPGISTFTTYTLAPEEELHGQTLTSLNIAVLRNQLAQVASDKLNLAFTPNDVLSFTQQEAYLKGQLDMLQIILDQHDAAQEILSQSHNQQY